MPTRKWRNWQTHQLEGLAVAIPWGFESPLPHQQLTAIFTIRQLSSCQVWWVLVIEDLRDQAELWSDVCAEAGLNAMTAATGVQSYRRACDSQPAIILLDLMLPDIDGWEVC